MKNHATYNIFLHMAKDHNLVELIQVDPRIKFDIKYATADNFCKQVLYPVTTCFVHRDCAQALIKVQDRLEPHQFFLKVFDGYRPLAVQQIMWDILQDENYVMNPAKGKGRHTRGTAIDLTLVDAAGNELEMPSPFDDFTERAHRDNPAHSPTALRNMKLLEDAMIIEGFIGWPLEWWHYDLQGWNDDARYPSLNIPLTELSKRSS
jgi:D-alanyl-D-alanine dipeptidase